MNWFPSTDAFQTLLLTWLTDMNRIGLGPEDALFPDLADLQRAPEPDRPPLRPMQIARAATEAFSLASKHATEPYSPHSVRHTLAQLGDRICRNSEERKAWSLNLGHSTDENTWTYYGKVPDVRRSEIFGLLENEHPASSPEIELMLAYHEHSLILGAPEFKQAEKLVEQRRKVFRKK
ncbi:hypothetical protein ABEB22_04285 [Thioclava sp. 'Guangxiensis']|uniref:hypothetical protein n=1 Tax=Thioclava sp. 'Guangxiensis' TaxID=3149044 RepID=UPI003877EEB5